MTGSGSTLKNDDFIYEKIEKYIRELIISRRLNQGDRLLSEQKIGKLFKASSFTVRKAMRPLLDQSILEKIQGKGTFVKKPLAAPSATNKIGIVHCHDQGGFFNSPFYSAIMAGIETECQARKKIHMICPFFDYQDKGLNINPAMYDMMNDVDGLVMVDMYPSLYDKIKPVLQVMHKPVVVVNYEGDLGDLDSVVTNSREATGKMVEFLLKLGHTRIACVYMEMYDTLHPNLANRLAAYRETMQLRGPGLDETLIKNLYQPEPFTAHLGTGLAVTAPSPEWLRDQIRELMERPDPITAIFCPSDFAAVGVYALLHELGHAIPERVTLVGFDDTLEARTISPALTTVHVPLAEMGAMAVKRLAEKMREKAGGVASYNRTVLPGNIIERGSHRAIH